MNFRNLIIFRLTNEFDEALLQQLPQKEFQPGGPTDRTARGWIAPRGEPNELVFRVNSSHLLMALGIEEKLLPSSVVRQQADIQAAEIEKQQGYKPGRLQLRDIREQTELAMLPRAFFKLRLTYVWIDCYAQHLIIDTASANAADEVIEHLKDTWGELPVTQFNTQVAPGTAMTEWLGKGEAPGNFTIDRDGSLQASVEERASVRYQRHNLDSDEVRSHIAAGKTVKQLAFTWRDRISFVLTEQLHIKRIQFLDLLKEKAEQQTDSEGLFAANFQLQTGELALMIDELETALGGRAE